MLFSKGHESLKHIGLIIVNFQQILLLVNLVVDYNRFKSQYPLPILRLECFDLSHLSFLYKDIRIIIKVSKEMSMHAVNSFNAPREDHHIPIYHVKLEFTRSKNCALSPSSELAMQNILSSISDMFIKTLNYTRNVLCSISATSFALNTFSSIVEHQKSGSEWLNPLLNICILSNSKLSITPMTRYPSICLTRVNGMELILLSCLQPSPEAGEKKSDVPSKQDSELLPEGKHSDSKKNMCKNISDMLRRMHPEKGNYVILCPQGIAFNSDILDEFIAVITQYFGNFGLLSWLSERVKDYSDISVLETSDSSISAKSNARQLAISVNESGFWTVNFSVNGLEDQYSDMVLSDDDFKIVNRILSEKTNLCNLDQLKHVMLFLLELLISPYIPFIDVCKVLIFESAQPKGELLSVKLLVCSYPKKELNMHRSTIDVTKQLVTALVRLLLPMLP